MCARWLFELHASIRMRNFCHFEDGKLLGSCSALRPRYILWGLRAGVLEVHGFGS